MSAFDELIRIGHAKGFLTTDEIHEGLRVERLSPVIFEEFIVRIQKLGIRYEESEGRKRLRKLVDKCRERGYVTRLELDEALPSGLKDDGANEFTLELVGDLVQYLNDMGLKVIDQDA